MDVQEFGNTIAGSYTAVIPHWASQDTNSQPQSNELAIYNSLHSSSKVNFQILKGHNIFNCCTIKNYDSEVWHNMAIIM